MSVLRPRTALTPSIVGVALGSPWLGHRRQSDNVSKSWCCYPPARFASDRRPLALYQHPSDCPRCSENASSGAYLPPANGAAPCANMGAERHTESAEIHSHPAPGSALNPPGISGVPFSATDLDLSTWRATTP